MTKINRNRFAISEDLILLRQVIDLNPYEWPHNWAVLCENICDATGKNFSLRCVREHVGHLIKLCKQQSLKRLGTEGQHAQKIGLLQQIIGMREDHEKNQIAKGVNQKRDKNFGIEEQRVVMPTEFAINEISIETPVNIICKNECEDISSPEENFDEFYFSPYSETPQSKDASTSCDILNPNRKRKYRVLHDNAVLRYFKQKQDWEIKLKQKQLELEEKKLALDERRLKLETDKFHFEKFEREKQLEMAMQEKQHIIDIVKKQQDIIKYFMNNK